MSVNVNSFDLMIYKGVWMILFIPVLNDWVDICMDYQVEGIRSRGRVE